MTWAFAWESPDGDAETALDGKTRDGAARLGGWAFALFGGAFALWFAAYGLGLYTTLGWAEGSERHDRFGVRLAEEDSITGLTTMYLFAGQRAWWDYDATAEGCCGVRLIITRTVPRPGQVKAFDLTRTGRGRFEWVVPESGFYSFRRYHVPLAGAFGRQPAGSIRYSVSWGAD